MIVSFTLNGRDVRFDSPPGATLLDVLRSVEFLMGTKEGCIEGECGACTVLVNGSPVDSCLIEVHTLAGDNVLTIEGLSSSDGGPTAIQRALAASGGVQCGFCTPGFVMTLTALLEQRPRATEAEVRRALAGNLCRCTGYAQIVDAALALAERNV